MESCLTAAEAASVRALHSKQSSREHRAVSARSSEAKTDTRRATSFMRRSTAAYVPQHCGSGRGRSPSACHDPAEQRIGFGKIKWRLHRRIKQRFGRQPDRAEPCVHRIEQVHRASRSGRFLQSDRYLVPPQRCSGHYHERRLQRFRAFHVQALARHFRVAAQYGGRQHVTPRGTCIARDEDKAPGLQPAVIRRPQRSRHRKFDGLFTNRPGDGADPLPRQ
jgi:hypothetical protein